MADRTIVFISSTSDLQEEREALNKEVPNDLFELFDYKSYVPRFDFKLRRSKTPEEVCLDNIMKSKIFVALLGRTYGHIVPPEIGTSSISEWEFENAKRYSQERGIDIKVFCKDVPESEVEPQQLVFRKKVTGFRANWAIPFKDKNRLAMDVLRALLVFVSLYEKEKARTKPETVRWLHRHLVPIALASMGLLVVVFSILIGRVSHLFLVAACAPFALIPICCLALLWSQMGGKNAND